MQILASLELAQEALALNPGFRGPLAHYQIQFSPRDKESAGLRVFPQ